jgi:hypothetical protein
MAPLALNLVAVRWGRAGVPETQFTRKLTLVNEPKGGPPLSLRATTGRKDVAAATDQMARPLRTDSWLARCRTAPPYSHVLIRYRMC